MSQPMMSSDRFASDAINYYVDYVLNQLAEFAYLVGWAQGTLSPLDDITIKIIISVYSNPYHRWAWECGYSDGLNLHNSSNPSGDNIN